MSNKRYEFIISRYRRTGNTVNKLHAKFHQASLIKNRSNDQHTPDIGYAISGIVHRDSKTKKISLKSNFFGVSQKTVQGNAVRKLHVMFHLVSFIRKCFIIGGTESLAKKRKILFLERF